MLSDEQREIAKGFIMQDQSTIRGMQDARLHIGQLKLWGKHLLSSEQAAREEIERLKLNCEVYYGAMNLANEGFVKREDEIEQLRTQLNQAVEVLKEIRFYANKSVFTSIEGAQEFREHIRWLSDKSLSTLSQSKKLKAGDKVQVIGKPATWTLIDIQYEHDRYQVAELSGWRYGISNICLSQEGD